MRVYVVSSCVLAVLIIGCASKPNYHGAFEKLFTCQHGPDAQIAAAYVTLPSNFTPTESNPNYYTPNQPMSIFEHNVHYVGLNGVMMMPGPNASVEGTIDSLKASVEKWSGLQFSCVEDGCYSRITDELTVYIYPHETIPELVTLQCGFTGLTY